MSALAARALRVGLWLLLVLLALLLAATVAGFMLAPAHAGSARAAQVPPPAIDTAPGSGKPTLILLHGAGLNAHMWDAVIRRLDPRWRVIAIDLPGHGARRDVDYSVDASAEAVADAARRAAPAPVVLVGDSLGGYSAIAGAPLVPSSQLRGLVVSGASAVIPAHLGASEWAQRLLFRLIIAVANPDKLAARALEKYQVAPADARVIMAAGVNLSEVEIAVDALAGQDFRPRLEKIQQPVLFMNGEGDSGRVAEEPSFIAATPNASSYRFHGTGHGVSMTRPAEFATQLNAFAERVFAAAADPYVAFETP